MNDRWLISPIAWATTDDADALRRQLRELEAQREAGAQEINRLHREVIARDGRIEALEAEIEANRDEIAMYYRERNEAQAESDTTRRVAAARLRAVKRMKRVAQYWRAWGEEQFDAGFERAVQSEWGTTKP